MAEFDLERLLAEEPEEAVRPVAVERPVLRAYQAEVIAKARARLAEGGKRRIILVAPTGAGKTVVVAEILSLAVEKGRRGLFLVHRRELLKQSLNKLHDVGMQAGIIAPGFADERGLGVQIASIPTLHGRGVRTSRMVLPEADLIVVDECHHVVARTWREILDAYPAAYIVGLTATPCRADGRGLGDVFEELVECADVAELIKQGYLVPTRVFTRPVPKLDDIKTVAGEYHQGQLEERMNTDGLVGDVVATWHKQAEGRRTLVYAVDVAHSKHLCDEFNRAGVSAGHIDGTTPAEDRDRTLARLKSGVLDVVCNCAVLTEGFDEPSVRCVVLAKPTKSFGLYRQIVGRGLRPWEGKTDLLVLDHAGATLAHGFVDEPIRWELAPDKRAAKRVETGLGAVEGRQLVDCPECGAARWKGRPCPACGWRGQRQAGGQDQVDVELEELDRARRVSVRPPKVADLEPRVFFLMLKWICQERGYNPGWAANQYKTKHGTWPGSTWKHEAAMEPLPEVRSWVRSRQIAWARSQPRRG